MLNIFIVLGILFIHFLADFSWQTDWQAKNKHNNITALASHVTTYTLIWLFAILVYGCANGIKEPRLLLFIPITFICHFVTDYFSSKRTWLLHKQGRNHDFFVTIGFDQFLHMAQLLLTFYALT